MTPARHFRRLNDSIFLEAFGGSTEWPGVQPKDVEPGKAQELAAQYPNVAADIREFPTPQK
jgi:hypothetical protein